MDINSIIFTADDEMPDCIKCDHICDNFNCEKWCGPEHGWWGYQRTLRPINNENKKKPGNP